MPGRKSAAPKDLNPLVTGTGKEKAAALISESASRAAHIRGTRHIPGWLITALLALTPATGIAADRTLTLVAWNIEHLAAEDGTGCRPRDADEYVAIRNYLARAEADVVAFQEVENRRAASRVFPASEYDIHISERPARQFPGCYDIANDRLMQRTGIAVRKDITGRLGLRAVRQPDAGELQGRHDAGRWGVHLVLEQVAGDRAASAPALPPLHLLSLHLKSRCTYQALTGKKTRPDCALLHEQVNALSGWINARAAANQDFIIAGDFNRQLDQLSDEVWLRLEAGGMPGTYVDLEKVLHGMAHPQPYNPKFPYAIDHIIYNQALDALVVEEKTFFDPGAADYSDHLPLFAVFDLPTARE